MAGFHWMTADGYGTVGAGRVTFRLDPKRVVEGRHNLRLYHDRHVPPSLHDG
jgi:hypothetical protein